MLNVKTILDELSQSSDSILTSGVLRRDGVTLSSGANLSGITVDGSGYAFPLVAATASYGQKLSADLLDGELDWVLLTNDDSQFLIGQSGLNQYLYCQLALDSEIESMAHYFKIATDKIKSLLD